MNEMINKFLLSGNKFRPQMHLRQPGSTYTASRPFTKNKERIKKLKKQVIQNIFIETNKIYLKEQLLIKYYVIKHLILLKSKI